MENKERLDALLYPHLEEVMQKLKPNEIDYFINHIMLDVEKSLRHWKFKTEMKYGE